MVDGATPRAKQATLGHIAKREINRAKAMGKRHQLCVVTKSLMEDSLTADQRAALVVKCGALGRQVTTAERQAVSVVPKDFADLWSRLSNIYLPTKPILLAGGYCVSITPSSRQTVC